MDDGGNFTLRKHAFLLIVALGLSYLAFLFIRDYNTPALRVPHLVAEPFDWPKGCTDQGRYEVLQHISKDCFDQKYRFDEAEAYHLPFYRNTDPYFRVGDDLIEPACGFYRTCSIQNIYRGVFTRK